MIDAGEEFLSGSANEAAQLIDDLTITLSRRKGTI